MQYYEGIDLKKKDNLLDDMRNNRLVDSITGLLDPKRIIDSGSLQLLLSMFNEYIRMW